MVNSKILNSKSSCRVSSVLLTIHHWEPAIDTFGLEYGLVLDGRCLCVKVCNMGPGGSSQTVQVI